MAVPHAWCLQANARSYVVYVDDRAGDAASSNQAVDPHNRGANGLYDDADEIIEMHAAWVEMQTARIGMQVADP
jgi:hypothetical protein